jgi:hypothetical protein
MGKRLILTLVAVALVLGTGIAHGIWTLRWTAPQAMYAAARRVVDVPKSFGDWTSEELEVREEEMQQTEAEGYFARRYRNNSTGQTVGVMLLCGRTGPLATHPPTICVQGQGMQQVAKERRVPLPGESAGGGGNLMWADFQGTISGGSSRTRIFWGWSGDGKTFEAPDRPRVKLARHPFLYKLYVNRELSNFDAQSAGEDIDKDACLGFLETFLPLAQRALRAESDGGANPAKE